MSKTYKVPHVRIGASKMPPVPLLFGSTNTTAFAYVAASTTVPATIPCTTAVPYAGAVNGFAVEEFTGARFWFSGAGNENSTLNYTIVGWYKIGTTWFMETLAAGVATFGTAVVGTTEFGSVATDKMADTITETMGLPGAYPHSPADNTIAHLDVDVRNYSVVQVHLDIAGGPTAMNCVVQRFEAGQSITIGDVEASLGTLDDVVKAEDAAHTSGDKGIMGLAVRTDTRASLAGTTGDYAPSQLTSNGDVRTRDDDANTSLAALQAAAEGAARATIAKNSWVAITRSPRAQLDCVSVTSGNTATLTIWQSPDGGTNYTPVLRADTGAKARDIAVATGTDRIGAGTYADSVALLIEKATTHIYVQEEAVGTDDFAYTLVGLGG